MIDNGVRWELDPSNANTGEEGGFTNSLVIVPESVGYEYDVVTGTVLSGARTDTKTTAAAGGEKEIELTLDYPDAGQVYVAGEFNDWSVDATPMEKGDDGIWRATLKLKSGRYLYKFLVDGDWIEDPANPDMEADPYGGNNSVLTVE